MHAMIQMRSWTSPNCRIQPMQSRWRPAVIARMTCRLGRVAALVLVLNVPRTALSSEVTFESGPLRTHLLELFTSEGCSSCPPAEAWLSKLRNEPPLWREFVPISFHVDYWDRLGWRDPFAAKQWTARQYEYSARWKSGNVYTPGFVLDGREWRGSALPPASGEKSGVLRITVAEDDAVTARFKPETPDKRRYVVHLARLGFDLRVDVKAGENRGRKLQHDFVVLSLMSEPLDSETKQLRLLAKTLSQNSGSPEALAAWVTEVGQIEPIQATGGWLP